MELNDLNRFSVEVDDDGALLVHGEIDMAGGPILEVSILERESTLTPMVIDLADVSFIDSSGLRCLLGASRRAKVRGTFIALRHVGPEVMRLLEITGTTELFDVDIR